MYLLIRTESSYAAYMPTDPAFNFTQTQKYQKLLAIHLTASLKLWKTKNSFCSRGREQKNKRKKREKTNKMQQLDVYY